MSILQPSTILQSIRFGHAAPADPVTWNGKAQTVSQQLRSKSSLANLVHIAKHPVEHVVDSLDAWWDGYTKEQRARKQSFDQKRQILYLRLREVSSISIPQPIVSASVYATLRLRIMRIGKLLPPRWTTSRETMAGNRCLNRPITMQI